MYPLIALLSHSLLILSGAMILGCSDPDSAGPATETMPIVKETALRGTVREHPYTWLEEYDPGSSLEARIAPPAGYARKTLPEDSFGAWLRGLPLKPGRPKVLLYNGEEKGNQSAHAAVVKIDVGDKDLQQCADAVMRLRAEYLYAAKKWDDIHFNFTSGHPAKWNDWRAGKRPSISGNSVTWKLTGTADDSRKSFRSYLNSVFTYAGTSSLEKELAKVSPLSDVRPGDVFIKGGFPGHAVIVVDVAEDGAGKKMFMIAQSYMPAQEIHILRNPSDDGLSPWYDAQAISDALNTPEWTFSADALKRFQ